MQTEKSFFPIRIALTDQGNKEIVCQRVKDVPNNTAFRVLETRLKD